MVVAFRCARFTRLTETNPLWESPTTWALAVWFPAVPHRDTKVMVGKMEQVSELEH